MLCKLCGSSFDLATMYLCDDQEGNMCWRCNSDTIHNKGDENVHSEYNCLLCRWCMQDIARVHKEETGIKEEVLKKFKEVLEEGLDWEEN